MANIHRLMWENPTQNTDGTAYNAATENAGYELALDGEQPSVTLPFAFGTEFTLDSEVAAYDALPSGAHTVRLRVVNRDGIYSAWTGPGTFRKVGTPRVPASFQITDLP